MDNNSTYSFIQEPTVGQPTNTTNDPTSSDTQGYSFVKENASGTPQNVGPINSPDRSIGDYGKAFLRGAAKATGTLPEDIDQVLQSYPYTPSEHIAEKAGIGTAFGAPFGLLGASTGAISGGTEETVNQAYPGHEGLAAGAGIIAGIGAAPIIANLAEFGAKSARSIPEQFGLFKSPVNSLYDDIGNKARIAGANDSWTSLSQVQNALREGLGGSGQIQQAEQKIFNAVETRAKSIADNLGPDLTHQELGEFIQGHAGLRADQLRGEISSLYQTLDATVPRATQIDPYNFTNMLHSIESKYAGAPELGKVFQQSGIQKYLDAVNKDLWNSPTGTIPYDVVKNIRTDIGEMIGKGAINPDVNVKELRGLYRSLTEDMEGAFSNNPAAGTNGLRAFRAVNAFAEKGFDTIEHTLQPLVKAGLTPENITTRLLAQANKGSSRIDDITSQLNNINPNTRNTVMGYVLRRMGETPQNNFNPSTFYGNWQKLSPEAKDLFPKAQQEGIDRLAQLSGLVANSFEGANRSHTSGNLNILDRIGTAVRLLSSSAGIGIGAVGGQIAGQEPMVGSMLGSSIGGTLAATVGESTINNMVAKLWTNKAFNTWIATEAPNLAPNKLATSMAALAAQEPQIADALHYLSGFIGGSSANNNPNAQLQPGEKGRGFALGGLTNTPRGTQNRGHPNKFKGKQLEGYAEGGTVDTDPDTELEAEVLPPRDTVFGEDKLNTDSIIDKFMLQDQGIYLKGNNKAPSLKVPTIKGSSDPDSKTSLLGNPKQLAGGGALFDGDNVTSYEQGGATTKIFSANDNVDSSLKFDWDKYKVQPVGMMNKPRTSIIDTVMKTVPMSSANDFAQGGIAHDEDDARPFYNPQPNGIDQGGWAEGGIIGYADGGPTWEVQHNNFGGMRIPGVNKTPSQGGFQSFNTPEEGVTKIRDQLMRYFDGKTTGKQLNTLASIVSTWAPPNENPTAALIKRAESILGIPANKPLDLNDANTMAKLIEATIRNEQGNKLPIDPSVIQKVAHSEYLPSSNNNNNTSIKKEKGQHARQEEGPSIIDQVMAQSAAAEPDEPQQEEDTNAPLKEAIENASWIKPETKIASRAILDN